jgi:uncharacterized protein YegL
MSITTVSNELFIEKTLTFESKNINVEQVPIPIADAKFGILNLKAISAPLSQEELEFIFMIDCSGSMSDQCSDGRTKMQHIIHTLKNMILYFRENPSIKVHITIDAFDDKIHRVLERSSITDDNFNSIIAKVDKILPRGSTNIEIALKSISSTVTDIREKFCSSNIINIFMTDGDATSGNMSHSYLANIVDKTITNAFIGFGIEHDAVLLNNISNCENSSYYFVDKLENSGLVYGEILHGIVYKLLINVKISIQNGLIYDFKNNVWVECISVGEIVSESNKIYHIASSNPNECVVLIEAKKKIDDNIISISISNQEIQTQELTNYIYRQRTLQHLYIVSELLKRKNKKVNDDNLDSIFKIRMIYSSNSDQLFENEEKTIRDNLRNFIEEMKKYMKDNNLNDNNFMKNLCDDIYISYRTFGTRYATMYNNARQTSQGTQRCYNVSHTPEDNLSIQDTTQNLYSSRNIYNRPIIPRPKLQRHTAIHTDNDFDNLNHTVSNFADAPYLTPTSTQLMRDISVGINIDSSELSNENEN